MEQAARDLGVVMATQGVVSVTVNGKVVFKVICGCDGYEAKNLANAIRRKKPKTLSQVYDEALNAGFGCDDCLVAMSETEAIIESGEDLSPLYREAFKDPKFNPRWKLGEADYVEVVEMESRV